VIFSLESDPPCSGSAETHNALTFDLSPGGIRIVSCTPIPLGGRIKMDLALSRIVSLSRSRAMCAGSTGCLAAISTKPESNSTRYPEDQLLLLSYAYRRDRKTDHPAGRG